MKRTPMKRSAWPRQPERAERAERKPMTVHPATSRAVMTPISQTPAAPVLKDEPVRSEAYRRLVAAYPCKNCGIAGYSQAAHPNTGKGMGLKTDDRLCFPLCSDRPGVEGCHPKFDQYRLMPKEVQQRLEVAWGADQRRQIEAAGLWPKHLPKWSES